MDKRVRASLLKAFRPLKLISQSLPHFGSVAPLAHVVSLKKEKENTVSKHRQKQKKLEAVQAYRRGEAQKQSHKRKKGHLVDFFSQDESA